MPGTGLNQWPPSFPEFKVRYEAYVGKALDLGRHVARLIALSLELLGDYIDARLEEPPHYCRILKYPPMPKDLVRGSDAELEAAALSIVSYHTGLVMKADEILAVWEAEG